MINLIQGKYEEAKKTYNNMVATDYFEFHFSYVPSSSGEKFKELERFLYESKKKKKFNNYYKGLVLLDLTDWNDNDTNEFFDAFMYYLKDHFYLECTFIVQNICKHHFLNRLKSFFDINLIELQQVVDNTEKRIGFYFEERCDGNVRK